MKYQRQKFVPSHQSFLQSNSALHWTALTNCSKALTVQRTTEQTVHRRNGSKLQRVVTSLGVFQGGCDTTAAFDAWNHVENGSLVLVKKCVLLGCIFEGFFMEVTSQSVWLVTSMTKPTVCFILGRWGWNTYICMSVSTPTHQ